MTTSTERTTAILAAGQLLTELRRNPSCLPLDLAKNIPFVLRHYPQPMDLRAPVIIKGEDGQPQEWLAAAPRESS